MYFKIVQMVNFMLYTFVSIKYVFKHRLEIVELNFICTILLWSGIDLVKNLDSHVQDEIMRPQMATQFIRVTWQRKRRLVLKLHVVGICGESCYLRGWCYQYTNKANMFFSADSLCQALSWIFCRNRKCNS